MGETGKEFRITGLLQKNLAKYSKLSPSYLEKDPEDTTRRKTRQRQLNVLTEII